MPEKVPVPFFSLHSTRTGAAFTGKDSSLASRSAGVNVNGKFFKTRVEDPATIFGSGSWGFDLDRGRVRERELVRERWEEEEEDKEGVRLETGDATLRSDCECKLSECKLYAEDGLF